MEQLYADVEVAEEELVRANGLDPNDDAGDEFLAEHGDELPGIDVLRSRARALLEEAPGDEASRTIVIQETPSFRPRLLDRGSYILALERGFRDRVDVIAVVAHFQPLLGPEVEAFLERVVASDASDDVRAHALFGLGRGRSQRAWFLQFVREPREEGELGHLREFLHPSTYDWLLAGNRQALEHDAIELLERVRRDHADVRAAPWSPDSPTLGELAGRCLSELEHVVVGRTAQEIAGQDLEGTSMTLSELRGKVVLLVFWQTSWSREDDPEVDLLRELHDSTRGEPFEIVGVCTHDDSDEARRTSDQLGLAWRSFWDDEGELGGDIQRAWNAFSTPALYFIDADGVLRHRDVAVPRIGEVVDEMIAQTKARAR